MTIAVYLHRMSVGLAVVGLAVLGQGALASAAPTFTFKTTALPIPGVPGTGNILGAGARQVPEGHLAGEGGTELPRRRERESHIQDALPYYK